MRYIVKRSEAEAAFARIIKEYSSIRFGDAPELASRLITLAMNMGMRPPLPPQALKYEEIIPSDYRWEPE